MVSTIPGGTPPRGTIAYFSMEIGLDASMPTYAGGLGVLAGDSLRAAADLGLPLAGVTLIHRRGYFRQHLDAQGLQTETPAAWAPEAVLEPLAPRVTVPIEGRDVHVRAWLYRVKGVGGYETPVYLLDTNLPENDAEGRALTDELYGGDNRYRLCQEAVLGLGGIAILRALGYEQVRAYHMNEGHSGLLTVALLEEQMGERGLAGATEADIEAVRRRCVFTVHTPVAAGHDRFPLALVEEVLGPERGGFLGRIAYPDKETFNMTYLAITMSRSANGVSFRHGQVSRIMFPQHKVSAITNGVHAATWASPPFAALFDEHVPAWRVDNRYLRHAIGIPLTEVLSAHEEAQLALLAEVARRTGNELDPSALTIGFARRATGYKRADLLFRDLTRLRRVASRVGPIQVIYGGKAHGKDDSGKALIQRVFTAASVLGGAVKVVYLEDYDMALAKLVVSGCDLWLNTPLKPLEASGTSGMKAALNGIPSLSTVDGWWVEGLIEGVTGWAIGDGPAEESDDAREAASLYDKLEYVILPLFYQRPAAYAEVMRSAIAVNGAFFNAQRMMSQYYLSVYRTGDWTR